MDFDSARVFFEISANRNSANKSEVLHAQVTFATLSRDPIRRHPSGLCIPNQTRSVYENKSIRTRFAFPHSGRTVRSKVVCVP
jgi:hypothetical protein